jgi:hypothetical protein
MTDETMIPTINYYPIALIAIIGGAVYFLSGTLYNPDNIDMVKYQQVCEKYLSAQPGEVSRDAMKSLVYKIDYLLPKSVNELSDPTEKAVKRCAQKLNKRLEDSIEVQ